MIVTLVVLALHLTLPTGAVGQYKVLHRFGKGIDGQGPDAALILDREGNLYGTTSAGGASGGGTVFQLTTNSNGGWTESVLYNLPGGAAGYFPFAGLVLDSAGNLYGAASLGGDNSCDIAGCGTIFKLTANSNGSWTPSVLHTFTGADGDGPYGSLVFDAAGKNLFGTTIAGGAGTECTGGCGVVFELTPNSDGTWTESVLHSFAGADGQAPRAAIVFDAAGKNLFGTTVLGGSGTLCTGGCGVVFELTPNSDGTWTESVLHSFTGADGIVPYDALVLDAAGNLYGTTSGGGSSANGVVFKLTPKADGSWKETVLHNFRDAPCAEPIGGLIFDPAGSLYGTTWSGASGNGTVFKMIPNSNGGWTFTALHAFAGMPGTQPFDSLVLDTAGRLYGTTSACGSDAGCSGTVFEVIP